jgi:glycosyltransferase involved in cell wall biosynthesis
MDIKITALILTKNESHNIRNCLDSIIEVDDIIVGDMGSTDSTLEIVKEYTKRIINIGDLGYAELGKNKLISNCKSGWMLLLDADERLSPRAIVKIKHFIERLPDTVSAIIIPRRHQMGDFVFNSSGLHQIIGFPAIVKSGTIGFWPTEIHAVPEIHGDTVLIDTDLEVFIQHLWVKDIESLINKLNRYTTVEAGKEVNHSLLQSFITAADDFLNRLNVEIDGARSFVIAFNFFFYELSKYMKYMEKNNRFEMIEKNEIEIIAKLIMGMRDKLLAKVNGNLPQEDKLIHVTRQFIEMSRTADNLYLQLETEKKIKKLNNATLYDILLELIRRIK